MKRLLILFSLLIFLIPVKGQFLRTGSAYTKNVSDEGEPSTLLDGLVSVWKLDETSGTTMDDAVGSNDGTLSGATVNQAGKIGRAVLFDAANEIINCGTDASIRLTDSLSISFWAKAAASQGANGRYAGREALWIPYISSSSGLTWIYSGGIDNNLGGDNMRDNAWHHTVITFSVTSDSIRYYVDGSYVGYQAKTTAMGSDGTTPFTIGNRAAGDRYFTGTIDNVILWNRELTSDEVNELYTSENAGTTYPW